MKHPAISKLEGGWFGGAGADPGRLVQAVVKKVSGTRRKLSRSKSKCGQNVEQFFGKKSFAFKTNRTILGGSVDRQTDRGGWR